MDSTPAPTEFGDIIVALKAVLDRLRDMGVETTAQVLKHSAAPDQIAKAYAALADGGSAAEGRIALREALIADGLDEQAISAIDAQYIRCVVGGPISNPL